MNFDISHVVPGIDAEAFERLYFDEPFNIALCEAVGLQRRLIALERSEQRIVREVEVQPNRDIPAPVRKILGDKPIAYTETIEYALGSGHGLWRTRSSILSDKISSQGELWIRDVEGGVQRQVTGDVTVRIFGLGGLIERFIVADVEKSYTEAANFCKAWLDARTTV